MNKFDLKYFFQQITNIAIQFAIVKVILIQLLLIFELNSL